MSTLSEAEKRKILRERRLNKIKKSGEERLNKITGGNHTKLKGESVETPVESVSTATQSNKSKRISQNFDETVDDTQDPEIEDIANHEPVIDESEAQEFERALQQLLRSEQHQHSSTTEANPQFDLLNQLLSGASGVDGGASGFPNFGDLSQFSTPPQSAEDHALAQELSEYKRALNDKYKAKFLLTKFVVFAMTTLYFIFTSTEEFNYKSSIAPIIRYNQDNLRLFKYFTALEMIFTSVYYFHLSSQRDSEYNYQYSWLLKYLGYIPDAFLGAVWKGRIRLVVKYLELLNFTLFGLAVIIVTFGTYALITHV